MDNFDQYAERIFQARVSTSGIIDQIGEIINRLYDWKDAQLVRNISELDELGFNELVLQIEVLLMID